MMPFGHILHEGDAQALCGVRDEQMGLVASIVDALHRIDDIVDIIAIHLLDVPSKSRPTVMDVLQRHHIFGRTGYLQTIAVDDGNKIVEMVFIGRHSRLVDGTLGLFAVAHDHKGLVIGLRHLRRKCHAYTDGKSVTKGTRANLHPGDTYIGMSTQVSVVFAIGSQFLFGNEALVGQDAVKSLSTMAFAEHKPVARRHLGIRRIHP